MCFSSFTFEGVVPPMGTNIQFMPGLTKYLFFVTFLSVVSFVIYHYFSLDFVLLVEFNPMKLLFK